MTIRRKGAAPWSVDYEAGLADAPVSSHPGVEADLVNPVIDAGFIDEDGNWQIDKVANDRNFTFQDPNQALGPGASLFIDPTNMLEHDLLILGIVDTSGNDINVDIIYQTGAAAPSGSPYEAAPFLDIGITSSSWKSNDPGDLTGSMVNILEDTSEALSNTWIFYKIGHLRGTLGKIRITNNDGANTGTISTAYLRLV